MCDTRVNLCGVELKNPVVTASGTFGFGREFAEFFDLGLLGGVTVKGVSDVPWNGNPTPRVAEVKGGMLNAIGLQNPGVDYFLANDLPFLRQFDTKVIVNICGHSLPEYVRVTEKLRGADVDLLELNISCPNVAEGGLAFGTDPHTVEQVVREVKAVAHRPLLVKLTPNVTDITEIARAAEAGGADGLSLINTLQGMKIDIYRKKAVLQRKIGGYSGPGILPVAVRMVYQVAQATSLPILGMGGIATGTDAIEFMLAGATAVAVGTANFMNPHATIDVLEGIEAYCEEQGVTDVNQLIGALEC